MQNEYTVRARTIRVDVDAVATRAPGRGNTWTATAGHWRVEGGTEKTAADALVAGLREFLTQYRPPAVFPFRGYSAIVSPDLGDAYTRLVWREQIVTPSGQISTNGGAESWQEAVAHARNTLAHLSTDWHDDDSVREAAAYLTGGQRFGYDQYGPDEFLRYAAWQRAARAAINAGRDDWHEWASTHEAEFAIPTAEAVSAG